AGDFNADGRPDLAVANSGGGSLSVFVNDGTGAFLPANNFTVGSSPKALAVGDFNGDGKADVLVANAGSSDVSLLTGDGTGNFGAARNFNVGQSPIAVAAADFNGDGKLDAALATGGDSVVLLPGDGAGGFGAKFSFATGPQPRSIVGGDFNRDGKADLAVAVNGNAQIFLGSGTGAFTPACTGAQLFSLIAADLNADGKLDLIGISGANTVAVMLGTGTGCFGAPTSFSASPSGIQAFGTQALAAADYNGDGKLDVAAVNIASNNLSLLPGDGTGNLLTPTLFGGGRTPTAIAAADFDGDGKADVASANRDGNNVSLYFGRGEGGFKLTVPVGADAVAVADFNGDGKNDLAVTSSGAPGGVTIFLGDGAGGFDRRQTFPASNVNFSIEVGDFNRDNKPDVAVTGHLANDAGAVVVMLGDGAGALGAPSVFSVAGDPFVVSAGDFNGDGNLDLVTANRSAGNVSLLTGNGAGGFGAPVNFAVARMNNPQAMAVGDFNGDGKLDLAVPTVFGPSVLINNGAGGFLPFVEYRADVNTQSLVTRDFNGDGKLDLAAAVAGSGDISVLLGNGAGGFGAPNNIPLGGQPNSGPVSITSADFNGDGIADLATANILTPPDQIFFTHSASILLGDGAGGFGAPVTLPIGLTPWAIASGDLNGDGGPDLVTANFGSSDLSILFNRCPSASAAGPSVLSFSASDYRVSEGGKSVTVTVNRAGDNAGAASVAYATRGGTASDRSDYISSFGTLRFAPGETAKTFKVLIIDDSYIDDTESLGLTLGDVQGATLGTPDAATVTIIDNDPTNLIDPVNNSGFFVRQHYLDFLNREPDASGLAFWTNEIESCGANAQCREVKRVNVSAAFFLSIEFKETGYFVYRTYKTAYGDINPPAVPVPVRLEEFLSDTQEIGQGVVVGQGAWQQQLEDNKNAFALEFVGRPRFQTAFPPTMTADEFVSKLDRNAGGVLSAAEKSQLIAALGATPADASRRAAVLRQMAEDADLQRNEFNRAFVLMQYFGYLRRNPDEAPDADFGGYNFWLSKLNQFGGNFINAEMVKAFITSDEYRHRFSF
ncbi:MAG: hypothetical protein QOJ76_144, partial [Acidobacteriota bacterium]|nr:hypothetical protein [Acidobacteriota bacterium]